MRLYTIGFTQKSAEEFFDLLSTFGIEIVIDIRLNPHGQLSGFSKTHDLKYFLSRLIGCEYQYLPVLAPSPDILGDYRKDKSWSRYVQRFTQLMDDRNVPSCLDMDLFREKSCCLLRSEATPEQCHRRLVAEQIGQVLPNLEIVHL